MNKKLFKVTFANEWDEDGIIYILSYGFDEAAENALMIKEQEMDKISILDEDGSLIDPPKTPRVRNVELLTENIYGIKDR